MNGNPLEYFETPAPFTRYLFREMRAMGHPIIGDLFEPTVGNGAIIEASGIDRGRWATNDLDRRWPADDHGDARKPSVWVSAKQHAGIDWTVGNPPFTGAIEIAAHGLGCSEVGVALHLRASIHEVLKTGVRRTWMARHTPTGILWLPRFAYQRSKTTGEWTTDTVCACWVIWLIDEAAPQFIRYAPASVLDELEAETPAYRTRMDGIMAAMRAA